MIAQAWDSSQDKFKQDLRQVIDSIEQLLIQKNADYGNAALEPKRIFSKASTKEQLLIRIDDKLSRIANQKFTESDGSDTITDLIGYLVMYKIAELRDPLLPKVSNQTMHRSTAVSKQIDPSETMIGYAHNLMCTSIPLTMTTLTSEDTTTKCQEFI